MVYLRHRCHLDAGRGWVQGCKRRPALLQDAVRLATRGRQRRYHGAAVWLPWRGGPWPCYLELAALLHRAYGVATSSLWSCCHGAEACLHGATALLPWHGGPATSRLRRCYIELMELLPWRRGPAAMGRWPCYHGMGALLPWRGGPATLAWRPCYLGAAALLSWRGGPATLMWRPYYLGAAVLLQAEGDATRGVRWCEKEPSASLQRRTAMLLHR
jgi:hypothetical protein